MSRDDCEAMGTTLSEASRQALDREGWRSFLSSVVELPMRVSHRQGIKSSKSKLRPPICIITNIVIIKKINKLWSVLLLGAQI